MKTCSWDKRGGRSTSQVEVEGETEPDALGHLERERPRHLMEVKISAQERVVESSVVREEGARALPLAFLPAIVRVGFCKRRSEKRWGVVLALKKA